MKQIVIMRASYGESFNQKRYEKEKRIAEAAPELLDALEKGINGGWKKDEHWSAAKEAIAKAKGKKL